jgi:hypothetical protein
MGLMRARRPLLTVLVALCAVATMLVLSAQAFALSAERHYEMVSPVYKGGFGTPGDAVQAVAPDGESVGFYSPGSFAGTLSGFFVGPDYLARRNAAEWSTVPMNPPATAVVARDAFDLTPSLGLALMIGGPGTNSENSLDEADFLQHKTDKSDINEWILGGAVAAIGAPVTIPQYESASRDLCHILVITSSAEPLLPEAAGTKAGHELYEFDPSYPSCGGSPQSVALVGQNNKGELISRACDTRLGGDGYSVGTGSKFGAVSADGSEVFFTVCVKNAGGPYGAEVPHQVFARLSGSRTIEVSRPLLPPCETGGVAGEVPCKGAAERASADFQGASEDGSRMYFTASLAPGQLPLVPGDGDRSNNLYMTTVGCPGSGSECEADERQVTGLTEVSHDAIPGQAANVLGVTRVSLDGTRVYFVAEGDLLDNAQREALVSEGRNVPQVGARNFYAYNSTTGVMSFVGDLCSDTERSGSVEDIHCPAGSSDENLWMHEENQQAQTGGVGGRFLVFATYAQLTDNDRNIARDVYRYDAATGRLDRVSLGEDGFDDNGNRTVLDEQGHALGARIMPSSSRGDLLHHYELGKHAISEDGSRVVFTSAEPLSPLASNGLENAYEWREGSVESEDRVSLVSGGGSAEPVSDVAISLNGAGVFFVTVDGLAPQDTDGAPDVYDARIGEGFSTPSSERRPCEGDACQGALKTPVPLLVPGSVSQASGDNYVSSRRPAGPNKHKVKRKPKKKSKKKGRYHTKDRTKASNSSGGVKRTGVRGRR